MRPSRHRCLGSMLAGLGTLASVGCGLDDNGRSSDRNDKQGKQVPAKIEGEREIVWGKAVDGWSTRIWTQNDQSRFVTGKPVPIHYAIKNVGETEQIVVHRFFWKDHRLDVFSGENLAPLTDRGRKMREAFNNPLRIDEKTTSKTLKLGEVDSTWSTIDLRAHYDLFKPGTYHVQVIHQATRLVMSNELTIEIVAP